MPLRGGRRERALVRACGGVGRSSRHGAVRACSRRAARDAVVGDGARSHLRRRGRAAQLRQREALLQPVGNGAAVHNPLASGQILRRHREGTSGSSSALAARPAAAAAAAPGACIGACTAARLVSALCPRSCLVAPTFITGTLPCGFTSSSQDGLLSKSNAVGREGRKQVGLQLPWAAAGKQGVSRLSVADADLPMSVFWYGSPFSSRVSSARWQKGPAVAWNACESKAVSTSGGYLCREPASGCISQSPRMPAAGACLTAMSKWGA